MENNKRKAASRSQSKRSTNRKPATPRAPGGTTAKPAATKAAGRAKRTKAAAKRSPAAELSAQPRAKRIALAAYFFAEQRGFAPNHELDDWLAAERSL